MTKHILVIAPYFADAERAMSGRIVPANCEWSWFCEAQLARLWLIRCKRRNVEIDPVWVYANTAERRAA